MAALAEKKLPGARPGTAPPIRDVTDEEVARHLPLVHHTLQRLYRQKQIAQGIEYDDLVAVGWWGAWEALRRWKPEKGAQSSYMSSYIWGYVMKYQRDATKATGWNRTAGGRIATVVSYEETIVEDVTIASTLAAPDDTEESAAWSLELQALDDRVATMPEKYQVAIVGYVEGRRQGEIASEIGVTRQRVNQIQQHAIARLAQPKAPVRRVGVLLIDRTIHTTPDAARGEALKIHPGCEIIDISRRKVRKGRIVAPQGRRGRDGTLGRPVWAVELAV